VRPVATREEDSSILLEMGRLIRMRPSADAPPERLAAFYRAKARLHQHIAALGGADAAAEYGYAVAARRHAASLLRPPRGNGTGPVGQA
jgi:hypothetical protein